MFVIISITVFSPENIYSKIYLLNYKIDPKIFYIIFGVLLILITSFRHEGIDRDYASYIDRYNNFKNSNWSLAIEPTFTLISKVVKNTFNDHYIYLFIIYAILGISTKLYAIDQLSQFWALSLLIYLSYLFTLQDLTQIRAGVSTGFMMLSIKPLYERKVLNYYILIVAASLFHYSALIALFFWFLNPNKIDKYFFISLIPVSYAIHYFTLIDAEILKKVLFFSPLMNRFLAYQSQTNDIINIFNSWQLIRIGLSVVFIWKVDLITKNNRYGIILTKLYVLSTCIFVILAFNPSFASRFSDLLAFSDIILIPCILYFIKPEVFAKLIVVFIAFSYLFLNLFYNKILI